MNYNNLFMFPTSPWQSDQGIAVHTSARLSLTHAFWGGRLESRLRWPRVQVSGSSAMGPVAGRLETLHSGGGGGEQQLERHRRRSADGGSLAAAEAVHVHSPLVLPLSVVY